MGVYLDVPLTQDMGRYGTCIEMGGLSPQHISAGLGHEGRLLVALAAGGFDCWWFRQLFLFGCWWLWLVVVLTAVGFECWWF